MKKLLDKTFKVFAFYSLIVLMASIPVYYYLVDYIWLHELDEHNEIIAHRIENELNKLDLNDTELSRSIQWWNKIQSGAIITELSQKTPRNDSLYTVLRQNIYSQQTDIDRFRGLSKIIQIQGKVYELRVETNVEETEETVAAIAITTLLFALILIVGFLFLNKKLSIRLWKPFQNTLIQLKTFNLNHQTTLQFEPSNTLEFEELNVTLAKLIEQNVSVYKTQKEFTENASHELQTPLAIIKNKLDLLLQEEILTERHYQIIEDANKALTRITRINKNLLLLAKIENDQFDKSEKINLKELISQSVEQVQQYLGHKNISIQTEVKDLMILEGNKVLLEILINNLLLNAIRYNTQDGMINIFLNKSIFSISNSGHLALDKTSLFQRFVRNSRENVGSGLGLAIIKEICNHYQWEIEYSFQNNFHSFSISF